MLRTLRSLSPALAVALLAAPAAAHAAPVAKQASAAKSKKASTKTVYPTVSSIKPRKITVGQKLTILGKNFRAGKGKSSVAFYKSGKPVVFIKADTATTTKLVVTIPNKLADILVQKDGAPVATMLRLRVIGARMGRSWTQNSRSPIVSPVPVPTVPPGTAGIPTTGPASAIQAAVQAYVTCQQQAAANLPGDNDADGLTNGQEIPVKLDPCNADTDGDSLIDGYEYDSAVDLNGTALPYPGTRPWPNPLDPTDVNYDFDGDGLQLHQEYKLWQATGSHFPLTQYSDGTQNSGGKQPVAPGNFAQHYLDLDGDGNLTDDERDEDNDGLSNNVEFNFRGTQAWWNGVDWRYKPHGTGDTYIEPPYTLRAFADPDPVSWDSDGDGLPDGSDDQDNDGWSNFVEMQLDRVQTGYRVHPFNPCLPDPHSAVCSRYIPLNGTAWPPFDKVGTTATSAMVGDAFPFAWPEPMDHDVWANASPFSSPAPPTFPTGTFDPTSNYAVDVAAPNNEPLPTHWLPTDFGPWDVVGWFTGAWDGHGGQQGP